MKTTAKVRLTMLLVCAGLVGVFQVQASTGVHWSQDGSRMVAASDTAISVFDSSGNQLNSFSVNSPIGSLAISPDASNAAYITKDRQVWIQSLNSQFNVQVSSATSPLQLMSDLAWSPSGTTLTFSITDAVIQGNPTKLAMTQVRLYTVNSDGTGLRVLMSYTPVQ